MMRALAPSIALLMLASGAAAAEGDVREFPFECHVVGADGSTRAISGKKIEIDATHNYQPHIKHAFEIVDRGEERQTDFISNYPEGTFEAIFSVDTPKDTPPLARFHHYESYKIDWSRAPDGDGLIVLQNWSEPRPAVKRDLRRTAAGMCKFLQKGVDA